MNFAFFFHSLRSDWNNGNAHFYRGIVSELLATGHRVRVHEPADGWSLTNLVAAEGEAPLEGFRLAYPELRSESYDGLNVPAMCAGADAVIVHEWNSPELLGSIAEFAAEHPETAFFFHDTHHRAVSDPTYFQRLDLGGFDAVLAYGRSLARAYEGKVPTVRVWHEAADVRRFRPLRPTGKRRGVVWIGNWGDDERAEEISEFLIEPVRRLACDAAVYGVRYPDEARKALAAAGIVYGGWLPNYQAPEVFARHRATVHIPRGPYVRQLPGIPTIRPFEALACGIPLVSAPWTDEEGLFTPGKDFLVAADGEEMTASLDELLRSESLAAGLRDQGLRTIHERHTCAHRVRELLAFATETLAAKAFGGAVPGTRFADEGS